jgi:hypothetical protein
MTVLLASHDVLCQSVLHSSQPPTHPIITLKSGTSYARTHTALTRFQLRITPTRCGLPCRMKCLVVCVGVLQRPVPTMSAYPQNAGLSHWVYACVCVRACARACVWVCQCTCTHSCVHWHPRPCIILTDAGAGTSSQLFVLCVWCVRIVRVCWQGVQPELAAAQARPCPAHTPPTHHPHIIRNQNIP